MFTQVGYDLDVIEVKIPGKRIGDGVLLPGEPLRVVRHLVVVEVLGHGSGNREVERALVAETRLRDPPCGRRAVPLAQ